MALIYKNILNSYNAYEFAIVLEKVNDQFFVEFLKILSTNNIVQNSILLGAKDFINFSMVLNLPKIGTYMFRNISVTITAGGSVHIRNMDGFVFAINSNVRNQLHHAIRKIISFFPNYYAASDVELPMQR